MKAFTLEITCLMEGGGELVTNIDQRDHAAFEASDLYDVAQAGSALKQRWLAWHALLREKKIAGAEANWTKFNTELCIQAVITQLPETGEESEGEQEPDPSRS